jgi:hypothetical protein
MLSSCCLPGGSTKEAGGGVVAWLRREMPGSRQVQRVEWCAQKNASLSSQVAFMTLTLFPIRLLFAAFMMLLAWPLALVASLGPPEKEPEQPLALWRK